jgi:hypothetical protein
VLCGLYVLYGDHQLVICRDFSWKFYSFYVVVLSSVSSVRSFPLIFLVVSGVVVALIVMTP